MAPEDPTLASSSNAIDAAAIFANLSDRFTGAAPDLGALERGCPIPLYGVRPDGIDETNEPTGCGGPTVTTTTSSTTTTTTLPWVLIRTGALSLRDAAANPARRKVSFKSSTRGDPTVNRIFPPSPGSSGDPRVGGATLVVYNAAGSGEAVTVVLPPSGWAPFGASGYRFRTSAAGDPIKTVAVRADRITLKGGKAGWAYTLDEPSQGRMAVRLTLGDGRPWCAAAPPKAGAANDTIGKFVAAPKTPAPASCPPLP